MTDDQETAVAPSGSLFDVGSAELWRLGQRRRARYIIKLLHQMLASLSSKQPHAQFVSTDEIETRQVPHTLERCVPPNSSGSSRSRHNGLVA